MDPIEVWRQRTVRGKMSEAARDRDNSHRVLHDLQVMTKILNCILGIK